MMQDDRPPAHPRTVETALLQRTRPANGAAGAAVPDYYALLGIDRNAPCKHLEQLYQQYVALLHPDKFFNDPLRRDVAQEKLKELNEAMTVLRDPEPRARYDGLLAGHLPPMTPLLWRLARSTGT